jgi:hypothetical protein
MTNGEACGSFQVERPPHDLKDVPLNQRPFSAVYVGSVIAYAAGGAYRCPHDLRNRRPRGGSMKSR